MTVARSTRPDFNTLKNAVRDGRLASGDVTFTNVTTLLDQTSQPFAPATVDLEGIALSGRGKLFISSEGDAAATPPVDPFVREFRLNGTQSDVLPVPPISCTGTEQAYATTWRSKV